MLNINATKTDAVLDLVLEGRLDTVTAPHYISSAGLRVLLTLRKSIPGELTLRNVDPSVMEVLEITGFVDILTIE